MLKNKTIILGVTGCIAAYKSAEIASRLKSLGADVWVVMTNSATKLVGPLTFRTLSGNPVIIDLYDQELINTPVPHIALAQKADLLVIAPATANIIGKLAQGIADDALSTIALASTAKKLLAPAMNCQMWRNPVVQENLQKLKALDLKFVGPEEGKLACGDEDIGRMSEPEEIVARIEELLIPKQDLKGKRVLVTAGGTRESIDPVRYVANHSSGKMGYAIAEAARERGAMVTLISANVSLPAPPDIKPVKVISSADMLQAVLKHLPGSDVVVMAAAVADFKASSSKGKIKSKNKPLKLELEPTEDILLAIAKDKGKGTKVVGFALETENLIANAKKKLKAKDLDLIVANGPDNFGADQGEATMIDRSGKTTRLPRLPKKEIAGKILDRFLLL